VQRLLDASENLPTFLNDLLTTQAVVVAGTEAAAFLVERQGENVGLRPIAHIRPDDSDAETRAAAVRAFQNIMQPCVVQSKDGAIEIGSPDGGDAQYCLVTVLRNEGEVVAVSGVVTRCRDMERAKQRLTSMQLVAGYFELFALRRYVEQSRQIADQHQHVLQYAGAVGTAEGFESSAMNLCNETATRTGATRVSLGWIKGKQIKVRALSHTEKFDKKQELVVQLQKVMEECLDQEELVKYDPEGTCSQNVTRAAQELSRAQADNIVLSVPLRRRDEIVGVMALEFARGFKLDEQLEAGIGVATELLAPQLYDRYENDRYIWVKIGHTIRDWARLAVGPKHMAAKLIIACGIALLCFVVMFKPMYRVRASVVLAALERRSICAPYEGTLEEVFLRPGQPVKKDQEIARLRTTDLEVKLAAAEAQVRTKLITADKARKEGKIADQRIAEAEAREATAQANLLKYYIDQAKLKSPIDGVLLKGDLFDRKGAPVKQGDALFEIAQADAQHPERIAIEAEMQVSERDIQEVNAVAFRNRPEDGELATTSFPNLDHKFRITRIVPNGEPRDGENVFKIYATIEDPAGWMHPGLAGEARINIKNQPLYWWWTHRFTDWLKLKLWI
jgi:multidrug resistance efflux pump